MLVHHLLEDSARRTPEAVALIETTGPSTYGRLDRLANRYARLFIRAGVARGDRVVVALDNGLALVAAYMGALKAGAVAVPLPGGPRSDRLVPAVVDCEPRACIVDPATARSAGADSPLGRVPAAFVSRGPGGRRAAAPPFADLEDALEDATDDPTSTAVQPSDLAAIIYTSGSTGEPRGVMLSHANFVANASSIIEYLRLDAGDRVMCVLPFHYVYGLSLLHTHLAVGGSIVIDNRFAFPNVVLDAMREHRVTGFAGVPSSFALLLHRSNLGDVPLPDLRYVTQAGGPMPPPKILEWLERGPRADFYVMYGATEAAARLAYLPPSELRGRLGSIGRAIPNVELRVLAEDGRPAAPGEVGEIVARGPNISQGYWNRPDETRERFGPEGYHTGDLGYADADGYLYLVGRRHEMIKVGANRVGAREIEDVLHGHPAVSEAAVVAAPHALLGEVPVAFVALRQGHQASEPALRAYCAETLAPYKVPARIDVRDELPKLPGSGKLDKRALKALADQAASGGRS